jgi:hypothetical protein
VVVECLHLRCALRIALPTIVLVLVLVLALGTRASGQLAWARAPLPADGPMAYDASRGVTVLIGDGTWQWDGARWSSLTGFAPSGVPYFDAARQVVALVGPVGGELRRWTLLSRAWVLEPDAASPPAAAAGAFEVAYDAARQRVVLFRGTDGSTWEHDGTSWVQEAPTTVPATSAGFTLTYDAARAQTVLSGGFTASGSWDTWVWNGTDWASTTVGQGGPIFGACATFHAGLGTVVLYGGVQGGAASNALWAWDGTQWLLGTNGARRPGNRVGAQLVYDAARDELLLRGGQTTFGTIFGTDELAAVTDMWAFDGSGWSFRSASDPTPRIRAAAAEDPERGVIAVFGGELPTARGTLVAGTWEWDGAGWRFASDFGPVREDHAMAFDARAHRVLLFGGVTFGTEHADTWSWDGTSWSLVASSGPSPRVHAALAFHEATGRMVLFGGASAGTPMGDTWEWDGVAWTQSSASGPAARSGHFVVYDRARRVNLLFGGGVADTWEWDGAAWSQRFPTVIPSALSATYDAFRERVVALGSAGTVWEWTGSDWLLRAPAGTLPTSVLLAHDSARDRVVACGGVETSTLFTTAPPQVSSYGAACSGAATTPVLAAATLPWIGEMHRVLLAGVPNGSAAALVVGVSRTSIGGVPLPVSLAFLGAPGCALLTSGELVVPLPVVNGTGTWTVQVTGGPQLVGQRFFAQGIWLEPGANPAGLVLSNAIDQRVGAK